VLAEQSNKVATAAELLIVALEELAGTAQQNGDGVLQGGGAGEKARSKAISQAVRRRGEAIIRRVRRDVALRARMLEVQPGQGAELLRAAEQATAQAQQAGETITSQHARLRAARTSGEKLPSLDGDALARYADSMATLAQRHWAPDEETRGGCRIAWCVETVREFFRGTVDKEMTTQPGRGTKRPAPDAATERQVDNGLERPSTRLKLLDVGSCYDPFRRFGDLDVTAFDLCPAPAAAPTVFTGDILRLDVLPLRGGGCTRPSSEPDTPGAQLTALPQGSFDCVTLCLVLSYIPDALERTRTVWTARRLLRPRGLLLIITPHSTNRLTNSVSLPIFSEWRAALSELGFKHHKYERLARHHALAFSTTEISEQELRQTMPSNPMKPMRISFDLRGKGDPQAQGGGGGRERSEQPI
jgi:25S rRNA (adenine2142-N1)-methyltransferase